MKVIHQSVFNTWEISDKSIQSIIASPPYFNLRKYSIPDIIIGGDKECRHKFDIKHTPIRDNKGKPGPNSIMGDKQINGCESTRDIESGFCIHCHAWKGQHGLEPDYKLYLAHCKLWMQEAIRVLRDDGVIFINLGDSYNSHTSYAKTCGGIIKKQKRKSQNYPNKCKLLIPERFVIMCVDELGLILRNHIVWAKPNTIPESVTDRFSKKWESVFMFTKQPKYYFNLDAVREPHAQVSIERLNRAVSNNNKWVNGADGQTPQGISMPRPNRNYKGGGDKSREQNLSNIGSGYQRGDYLVANLNEKGKNPSDVWTISTMPSSEKHFAMFPEKLVERMLLCSTRPDDIILDPFCGSGTTLRVAERHNRIGIGIDLGYQDIQQRRLSKIQKELNLIEEFE